MTNTSLVRPAAALLAAFAFAACGGSSSTPASTTPAPAPAPTAAAARPAAPAAMSAPAGLPSGVTTAMVTLGDSLFHTACQGCHGADAKGTARAPALITTKFLHVSGSYDDFVKIVTTGVPAAEIKDPSHTTPMRARGRMYTDDQIKAVAAYVYSLNHK